MTTLTEVVAAVVVHSSAVAFSHFGIQLDPVQVERAQPAQERVVARTPRPSDRMPRLDKVANCPEAQHPRAPATA